MDQIFDFFASHILPASTESSITGEPTDHGQERVVEPPDDDPDLDHNDNDDGFYTASHGDESDEDDTDEDSSDGLDWDEEFWDIFRYLLAYTRLFPFLGLHSPHEIMRFFLPPHPLRSLFMGYVQSGKSEIIFASCVFLAKLMGINVIVVLRNFTADHNQFLWNFQNIFLEKLRTHLRSHGHDIVGPMFSILSASHLSRRGIDHVLHDPSDIEMTLINDAGSVVVALANEAQLGALHEILIDRREDGIRPYVLMVDEVDDIAYGMGESHHILRSLMGRSAHTIGISATVFDPLHDNRFLASRVRVLTPPTDYKGIGDFRKCEIQPLPSRTVVRRTPESPTEGRPDGQGRGRGRGRPHARTPRSDSEAAFSRLDRDPDLVRVLDELRHTTLHTANGSYPMIMLVKNEPLKRNQTELMHDLITRYKNDYTIIVHNSDSTTVFPAGSALTTFTDKIGITRLKPHDEPGRRWRGIYKIKKTEIQDVLQLLKMQNNRIHFRRILILSHNMIARGINIVDRDFEWHLTHMFYRPSPSTTLPMMLQSMRLCGLYKDSLILTLYTDKKTLDIIVRGHQLQQEVVGRIMSAGMTNPTMTTTEALRGETFHPKKIPQKSIFLAKTKKDMAFLPTVAEEGDDGWSIEDFERPLSFERSPPPPPPTPATGEDGAEVPSLPANEFRRLTNPANGMFKRWSDPNDRSYTTSIARFMREGLEPRRVYTRHDINRLWKQYSRGNRITVSSLLSPDMGTSNAYGQILVEMDGRFYLHPRLVTAFEAHF